MSNCTLTLSGNLIVGSGAGGCGSCEGSTRSQSLSLGCQTLFYEAAKGTECAVQVSTPGAAGAAFVELPVTLAEYGLLCLKSNAPVVLRIGAAPAALEGASITAVQDLDGSDLVFEVDGIEVTVAFVGDDLPLVEIVRQINKAAIDADLSFMPASVNGTILMLTGEKTGSDGSIVVTTGLAELGLEDGENAVGSGAEVPVNGLFLAQFGQTNAPARVQVSGNARIEILCAGSPA